MSLFASTFVDGHGMFLGCAVLVLVPLFGLVWFGLQIRSLVSPERLSWLSLAFVVAFSSIPVYLVVGTLRSRYRLQSPDTQLFLVSLCGLILVPMTLTREVLKLLRDRPPPRRRRDPRGRERPEWTEPE
jgi:hypothetical protein